MSEKYFVATDKVNSGKIFRCSPTGGWSEYNVGLHKWVSSRIIWEYINPESIYSQGNFLKEITAADVQQSIAENKAFWVDQWNKAKELVRTYGEKLNSPLDDMTYQEYVKWQSDFMPNERSRVLLVLSGFSRLSNYEAVLQQAGITEELRLGVSLYKGDAAKLHQTSNYWVLQTAVTELQNILDHPQLKDYPATAYRLARLQCQYADYMKYPDGV